MEENMNNEEVVSENNEVANDVKEEMDNQENAKSVKKTPWLIAIPVVIVVGLLIAFLLKNNAGQTFKLSQVYSAYFTEEADGSVKLPKSWAIDGSGLLYGVDSGVLSQKGYLVGFDCDEETFDGYVEQYATAYEVSELTGHSFKCHTFTSAEDDLTTKVYFCYKDDKMVELIVVDENADVDSILNSLTF